MKCPSCGYNSFDYLEYCKKCGSPLSADPIYRASDQEDAKSAEMSSGTHRENNSGDSLDSLFSERPLPADDTSSLTKSPKSWPSKRKRGATAENDIENESYELFPVSKEFGRGRPAENRRGNFPRAPKKKEPRFEEEISALRSDPFVSVEHEDASDEPDLRKGAGYGERETEVYNLAGIISRAIALIIDIVLVSLVAFLAAATGIYLVNGFNPGASESQDIFFPLYIILFFLASTYFVFLHGYGGKTVGKMMMGIKLINNEGERVGFWEAFVRWLGYYVSAAFLFAGFLWSLIDSEYQTWHDKLAGTYVVKD